jgi:mono/diheme cytochrome c family protein
MRWVVAFAVLCAVGGCGRLPGKPAAGAEVPRPDSIVDPVALYGANCAGCHGADGTHGPAIALGDPLYLAIADDDMLRSTIANGRPGTSMSAFSETEGGMLTDAQIDSIVHGIRERWGSTGRMTGVTLPPYAPTSPGNVKQGEATYATFCASCHPGSSVTDPSYLSLISDQGLRTVVITGRPDFGAPDWRSNLPGRPMSDQEISDVVAWLSSQRPVLGGAN